MPKTPFWPTVLVWLALGCVIEGVSIVADLYRFSMKAGPLLVVVIAFGTASPILHYSLRSRICLLTAVYGLSAFAVEATNALVGHWWQFSPLIVAQVPDPYLRSLLAAGCLCPAPILVDRLAKGLAGLLPYAAARVPAIDDPRVRRSLRAWLVIMVLLVAWGRYGNFDLFTGDMAPLAKTSPLSFPTEARPTFAAGVTTLLLGGVVFAIACIAGTCWFADCRLRDIGLSSGRIGTRRLAALTLALSIIGTPMFIVAAFHQDMARNYPFVRHFADVTELIVYEAASFVFFFNIELFFRSVLFLGVASAIRESPDRSSQSALARAILAGLLSCSIYTTWHLGKPMPELLGAIFWGPIAAVLVYRTRSLVCVVVPHYVWNVVLDCTIAVRLSLVGP